MSSLRFRLILGFSLVAVVPLVGAMLFLSQRIQTTVRREAEDRLAATLGILQARLQADGEGMLEKLGILARDPALKRLYLVQQRGGELPDFLEEKRFLLGLDFLMIADTSGRVAADASASVGAGREPLPLDAAPRPAGSALALERLGGAPGLAMTASAPIHYQGRPTGTLRGGVVLDSTFLSRLKLASGVDLVLRDPSGRVAATTRTGPPGGRSHLARQIPLQAGGGSRVSITGLVSTASADRTVAALRATSVVLGLGGVGLAVALGVLWSLQVSRPVERLARFSQQIAQGEWDEPLALHSLRELQMLVSALDRMRRDLGDYRRKLVASERQAAWSQMARVVAHEIRNPLTPIAVSLADLKRSFDQQRPDFPEVLGQAVRTIGEELEALKRLLHEFSEFGRLPAAELAPCRLGDVLADLETLYGGEVAAERLRIRAPDREVVFSADRAQLRQALVNLIQNGLEALDRGGHVEVSARERDGALEIAVRDTGSGLTAEQTAQLFVPHFTTKAGGSGLGLTIVQRIVGDHRGTIAAESSPGSGTTFRLRLPLGAEA